MPNIILAQKILKEFLHYNPETGIFRWLISPSSKVSVGDIAGHSHLNGYVYIALKRKRYLAHRLAWFYVTGEWPKGQIDHINHIKIDNKWVNLRDVSIKANQRNRCKNKNSSSGISGVYWKKSIRKWYVHIVIISGRYTFLGIFNDKFEAVCARKSAENKHGYHKNHGINKEL